MNQVAIRNLVSITCKNSSSRTFSADHVTCVTHHHALLIARRDDILTWGRRGTLWAYVAGGGSSLGTTTPGIVSGH